MTDPAIRVEGLTKRFDTVTALDGIDLEIPARTVFGLLGPNGAGKTTTIRILSTILKPDAGRAEVLGRDVARQAKEVRTQIGLAGQSATVDPNLTGRENLRLIGRLVHLPRREAARASTCCSNDSSSPPPPTGRCEPTRAACAAASTSQRRWSTVPHGFLVGFTVHTNAMPICRHGRPSR
jgi:ABC-type Fe3+/spermidine/putrescine transport system ATPase subunit